MATAALPYEINERVLIDAANTYGVPANTLGTVVGVYNSTTSTGIGWIVIVRVKDDARGAHDYHVLPADLGLAP